MTDEAARIAARNQTEAYLEEHGQAFTEMPWSQMLGIEMTHHAPGTITLQIDPKPEHHNQNDTVAAPILFALAEATGAAVIVLGFLDLLGMTYTVVREANMRFVAAARGVISSTATFPPASIEAARAEIEERQAIDLPISCDVCDASGRVVASVDMVVSVRAPR